MKENAEIPHGFVSLGIERTSLKLRSLEENDFGGVPNC
jgi:hypothetical protein